MVVQTEAGIPKRSCEREAEVNKMEISMVELLTAAGKKKTEAEGEMSVGEWGYTVKPVFLFFSKTWRWDIKFLRKAANLSLKDYSVAWQQQQLLRDASLIACCAPAWSKYWRYHPAPTS